jgi:hypothetical protein
MADTLICKYCSKVCKEVGPKYYVDKDDGQPVCFNCGVAEKTAQPVAEPVANPKVPSRKQRAQAPPLGVDAMNAAMDEILAIMNQRLEIGHTYQSDSQKSIGDFILYIERYLTLAKFHHSSEDPIQRANARHTMVVLTATALAFLQSHPHE